MRGTWKASAVLCVLGAVILALSLRARRPPIGITFSRYTNDIFGLYTFGLFDVTNGSRRYLHIRQGATELKTPKGWIEDTNNLGYRLGNVRAGDQVVVRWVGPGTNCIWRARFEFSDANLNLRWVLKLPMPMQDWVLRWYQNRKTVIATSEISPPE